LMMWPSSSTRHRQCVRCASCTYSVSVV
jgi:hypothetical protein